MSSMGELTFFLGLQVQQKEDGIFISQDKYVAEILKKFDFATVNTASTPMEPNKALVKDEEADSVDVHLYRLMIRSLMYLTTSRPDITFAVCACARFQVTPKTSHIHDVKRIFRYLKGQPKFGHWYPRDSLFDLEAFSDSDYAGANLDRKSTIGGCQFLSKRLISWQCKKQTIVANSTTKAEYVAAVTCCGQVLWIQNQMLDYGFNFMNTKIYIDNESTICIVKNPVFHSKTKHIEIRHHFIRDSYEKRLIQVFNDGFDGCIGLKMLFGSVLRVKYGKKLVSASRLALCCWAKVSTVRHRVKKTEENADFHQILDFLTSSSINFALNVSPTIYASYIEQFWNTACLKTINSEKQIHANVDGKAMVVSESSVRRDLYLNDEDGTACLTTNDIFENLALMGYEPASEKLTFYKGLVSLQWKYLIHTILHCLSSKSTSWDQFSTYLASAIICLAKGQKFNFSKLIFDGMLRNLDPKKFLMYPRKPGKGFSGRVTPLFQNMLVPPAVVGEGSEQPPEPQPTPSTAPLEVLSQVTTAAASQPPKDPNTYRRTRRGRNTKVPNTPHDSPLPGVNTPGSDEGSLEINELMDLVTKLSHRVFNLEKVKTTQAKEIASLKRRVTKLEQRQRSRILKNHPFRFGSSRRQSLGKKDVSKQGRKHLKTQGGTEVLDTEKAVNVAGEGVSTANVPKTVSTVAPRTPPTTTVFDDEDVTMAMAQTLIKMKEEKAKEKGVVIKGVEDSSRPVRSITTLQPLPTIDPKDKGKGIIQETKSVEKTKKKVQGDGQMEKDAEVALRLQAELDEELRVERERQEDASKLAAERAEALKNKPPTKTQLRNLRMTYLKNIGGYKHSKLKGKSYEEIQGLYARQQKNLQDFTPMDSEKEAQKPDKRLKRVAGSYATQKSPKKPKMMKSAKEVTEEKAAEYEKEKEEGRRKNLVLVPLDLSKDTKPYIKLRSLRSVYWDQQEVILFYNWLDVLTRQILDSKGAISSKTVADAKVAIQEMAEYS
ncbi:putative ribonuclease H-like domain-containing protein [Tanacetum coccineum]